MPKPAWRKGQRSCVAAWWGSHPPDPFCHARPGRSVALFPGTSPHTCPAQISGFWHKQTDFCVMLDVSAKTVTALDNSRSGVTAILKVAPTTDWWSQGQSSWLSWPLFTVIASGEMVSQFMTFKTAGHYQVKQCHSSWSSLSSETGSEFMPFWSLSSETGSEFILFTYVLFFT